MTTPDSRPPLKEKDFINEGFAKNPFPAWLWLFLIACAALIIMGTSNWFGSRIESRIESSPFLKVTNREFSLFLWQFSDYMRQNVKLKTGYLPGFETNQNNSLVPADADKFVEAPPKVLFLYHTWKRLVSEELALRPVPVEKFKEFINSSPAWQPRFWAAAPKEYADYVTALSGSAKVEEGNVPDATLPQSVKVAFQGWLNYTKEGEAINAARPTYAQIKAFLAAYPHYARAYWRNLPEAGGTAYLSKLESGKADEQVPQQDLAPFLRFANYNYSVSGTH